MSKKQEPILAHGTEGIAQGGHRDYVGGKWEEIGALQFAFLKQRGLLPQHVLLDVACGSLRGGVHFIPYLLPGNYLGIEKEESLIEAGLLQELGEERALQYQPEFVISSQFAVEHFTKKADFALAQSLFTHLVADEIEFCLKKLLPAMNLGGEFYATFFEAKEVCENPTGSHDHMNFHYTSEQMAVFGRSQGWEPHYIGEWGHPRGQQVFLYRKEQ